MQPNTSKFIYKTAQEWFDALVETSKAGKFPARDSLGFCSYLDPKTGNKCAVGIGIPDEYNINLVGSVYLLDPSLLPDFCSGKEAREVQRTHDMHGFTLQVNGMRFNDWNHDLFVKELRACSVFANVI